MNSVKEELSIAKVLDAMGEVRHQGKRSYVSFGLDSYAEMDFVSIDFVRSMGLKPCTRTQHNHHLPHIEAAGCTTLTTHGVYHLHCSITDKWGREFSFVRPFVAITRSPEDTPILLGRPALRDLRITLYNGESEWEFERKPNVEMYSSKQFHQLLSKGSSVSLYAIQPRFVLPPIPQKVRNQQLTLVHDSTPLPYRPLGPTTDELPDESDDEPTPLTTEDTSHIPSWLLDQFPDMFNTPRSKILPSHRQTDHAIDLLPDTEPPFKRMYNLSPKELQTLDDFIAERLAKGHIRESTSSAGAPILFAPKKDGTLRLCIDYRGLNSITVKNRYPLPLISELLDRFNGAKVFSKIDLKDAYFRIRIKEGDEWKTAFRTRYGHYEFLVLPFGLCNGPATFQSYISNALRGYVDHFCVVYLDDILIFSRNEAEHRQHLELVMERLRQSELYANPKKCSFYRQEVEFLGYLVNAEGVRMDPKRIETIVEWKKHPPKTYRDIQVFLGFCNFYRRFIFGFSRIATPIQSLLKGMKNGRKPGLIGHDWQEAQQRAFEGLIDCFTTAPILRHYDPTLPIRLETDASNAALAGILSQLFEDGWHPIAFFSLKFTETERHYPIYDKEMMGIVKSFDHWRHYLDGAADVEVYTDHQNLKDFMSQTRLNGRQTRWLIKLLPYDFHLFYRKGTLNPADGPSRRPDYFVTDEADDLPVAHLLPALRSRVMNIEPSVGSTKEPEPAGPARETRIQGSRVPLGESIQSGNGTNSSDSQVKGHGALRSYNCPGLGSLGAVTPDAVRPRAAAQEVRMVASRFQELHVTAADEGAKQNLRILCLQAITPKQSRQSLEKMKLHSPLNGDLIQLIEKHQRNDPLCKRIAGQPLHSCRQLDSPFAGDEGPVVDTDPVLTGGIENLLCVAGRVVVPEQASLRTELLRRFHDCPTAGHWGEKRTKELLQRTFYWPELGTDVKEWVSTCPQCQGKAIHRHKPYGQLQPFTPDDLDYRPFKHITVDWITGLPDSRRRSTGEVFNAILTVVCRTTKAARFIPTRSDTSAADFAQLFFENIECEYGTPTSVVSDRDSRITSQFWKEICYLSIIKRRLSTAFHPQTDGQSEALNRIVEDYLRAYCADEPTTWANLLPLARYAYNNSMNAATKTTPNNLLYGMDCNIRLHLPDTTTKIPEASARIEKLHQLRQSLRERLAQANERMAKYYNRNHVPKQFKKGQLVKLSTRNLRLKCPKLAPRWIGPFRILERIGAQAYRLALPDVYSRLHDVFPIQFLEDYHLRQGDDNTHLPMPELEDEQDEWEIQEIRNAKKFDGALHYLVKWTGWPSEYDSWEPADNLKNAPQKIKEFERRKRPQGAGNEDNEAGEASKKRKRRRIG